MYMNCAVVTISGGRRFARNTITPRAVGPPLFQANIGNGCTTAAGTDVIFPDPGNDVQYGDSSKTAAPVGSCGSGSGTTYTGGSNSGGSGNTATASGEHDCAYWRSQGYICSAGAGLAGMLPSKWWLLAFVFFRAFSLAP